MNRVIDRKFYCRKTTEVAKSILGMVLCRRTDNETILRGKIVEAEAYTQEEESCHAYRGITKRSITMFKKPGIAYVYMTYGMYHCLNIITEKEGYGAGVLIRALEPISKNLSNTNGPGKICRELNITRELNEIDVCSNKSPLWLEYGDAVDNKNIAETSRIGIKLAQDLKWRFYIKNNKFVSKP